MTRNQAITIIRSITIAYPSFDMNQEKLDLWIIHLVDMPYEAVEKKLNNHIRTSSFPPTISQIAVQEKTQNVFLKHLVERKQILNAE
ncbi:hypothetical protein COJ96_24180 [Bacillus sp. AFS073361]|uniref:replicative helicase loader/inhibitor n=1 Tax=Bacillus sp. AFS073361 TaxID=2033511 RepID=UPI000BF77C2F|nr:replicative helicase loader/inhibitor [Bacillus sp. AFS073361]PFP23505.1 hypothetical protein COJ96_24180 [Bacillus sp. AFS073361]